MLCVCVFKINIFHSSCSSYEKKKKKMKDELGVRALGSLNLLPVAMEASASGNGYDVAAHPFFRV